MTDSIFNEKQKEIWRVDIESFEGPLDLLLHLIKKKNLDIYDIPIAQITTEYLKYVELMKHLNLDNVGDFLVMASILMRIKSRMLLPEIEPVSPDDENVEEMKQNLIDRLIEYKKFKESSGFFKEREKEYSEICGLRQYPVQEFGETVEATLFDLIDAFQHLIENAREDIKDIITEEISIEDKIRLVLDSVEKHETVKLEDVIENRQSALDLVVTLLAILELVRTHQIKIAQKKRFGSILIKKHNEQIAA